MPRIRSFGRRAMEKPATMSERLAMFLKLLEETREGQEKGNAMLADLRVEVAAMQRAHEGQTQNIADMRAEMRQVSDRLRDAELQMQKLPMTEAGLDRLERRQTDIEGRVRILEGDGREAKVVSGAFTTAVRDVWRYVVGAAVGGIIAAVAWVMKQGGSIG